VVGRGDHRRVVLHHEQGVPGVDQLAQERDQASGVVAVKAGRRLVQHVQHAGELVPHLRAEAKPLRFAAGERAGGPVERDVREADPEQEVEAAPQLVEERSRDRRAFAVREGRDRGLHGEGEALREGAPAPPDGPRLGREAGTPAVRARRFPGVPIVGPTRGHDEDAVGALVALQ
jgi:hypothetical protein